MSRSRSPTRAGASRPSAWRSCSASIPPGRAASPGPAPPGRVYRTGQRFGAAHVIDVLRGNETEKVVRFGHHRLPSFGAGAGWGKNDWRSLIRQMAATGLLRLDIAGYGGLTVTDGGRDLLRSEARSTTAGTAWPRPPPRRLPRRAEPEGGRRRTRSERRRGGAVRGPQGAASATGAGARGPGLCRLPGRTLIRHGAPPTAHAGGIRPGHGVGAATLAQFAWAVSGRHRQRAVRRGLRARPPAAG